MLSLLDCTLRDGANVVGYGFNRDLTQLMIKGLMANGIRTIEIGNAQGLGAYGSQNPNVSLSDAEYLDAAKPYMNSAEIGMFMLARNTDDELIHQAASQGLSFIRVGANAGDGPTAYKAIETITASGIKARYSMMKAYLLRPDELAREAEALADRGLAEITIMDSAGTMRPADVTEYVSVMKETVGIPVGFHGHNNLGLSMANAVAAVGAGVDVLDCGLMGMARSAGNIATELAVALFSEKDLLSDVDLFGLLDFIDHELAPAMEAYQYQSAVKPIDLVMGLAGCHSGFTRMYRQIAKAQNVNLYQLIMEASKINRKNPTEALLTEVAARLSACGH